MASSPLACYSAPSSSSSSSYSSSSTSSTQVLRPCLSLLSSSNNSSLILSPKTTAQALRKTIFGTHVANSGRDVFSFCTPILSSSSFSIRMASTSVATASSSSRSTNANPSSEGKRRGAEEKQQKLEEDEEEVEEELPWIQEKALDLVEFTGSVTHAIPGPRVGRSSLPWILAVPLAYLGITFVFAFIKTVRKFNSPKEIRRKLVNKNAVLCKSIDELFEQGRDGVHQSALKDLLQKTGFSMEEIFRKYIRYALNEKPFNPDSVVNLIQLRKASSLNDSQVTEIINDISRRIVKDKGPVVMDMSGYSEKGFKRKLAVQALFGKVYYLSELPEFCARDSSLIVKEIFGVADEDAEMLRLHTLSEAGDVDSLEKMVEDSESKNTDDSSSNAP